MPTIILKGTEYSSIDTVGLPIIGGGEALFKDPSGTDVSVADVLAPKTFVLPNGSIGTGTKVISPYGEDPELLATYDMGTTKLSDTAFNGWTPSTSNKTIQATSNLGTLALDLDKYEYLIESMFESNTVYASGTTPKAAVVRQLISILQTVHRKPSNLTHIAAKNDNYNYCATLYTAPLIDYYNASGTHTMAWAGTYGIVGTATAATFSSASSSAPTLTVKAPTYNARCSNTYFSTTMAAAVDQDASTIKCVVKVYRIKKGGLMYDMYHKLVEQYNA